MRGASSIFSGRTYMSVYTDYGRPEEIAFTALGFNPKFLGTAEAYFVCHIGPIFRISLI